MGIRRRYKVEGDVDAFAAMVFVSVGENTQMEILQFRFRKSGVRLRRPVHRLQSAVDAALLHHFLEETWKSKNNDRKTKLADFVVLCKCVVAARFVLVV